MNPELQEFADNLRHWLFSEHSYDLRITKSGENSFSADIIDEEGEEFWIGNYADPGITITWLGDGPEGTKLVRANGIVIQALGRHVAGWAVGYL